MTTKHEPIIVVLNALCTLVDPSTQMIAANTGLSEWSVKRHLNALKKTYGVDWKFDRAKKAADGGQGHYVLKDMGIFDRSKVVQFCLPKKTE